jgi:hypothetical protein
MPLLETRGSGSALAYGLNSSSVLLPPVTSNLYSFYDASVTSSMTISGSNVTQWRDISGNGVNLESLTASQPTYSSTGFNSKPGISFNGTNQGFSTIASNISFSSPGLTVFMIGKFETTTVGILAEHTVDANSGSFYLNAGSGNSIRYVNGQTSSSLNAIDVKNTWASDQELGSISYRYDGTNAGHKIRKNGTTFSTERTDAQGTGDPGFASTTGKIYYMSRANTGIFAKGSVAEIIVYKRALSDSEITQLENYAYNKWGFAATTNVSSGLILHYDMGRTNSFNGSGSTWTDLSSNARNLNLVNSPTFDTANGGIIKFNGSNNSAESTSMSGLLSGSSAATVQVWYRSTAQDDNAMVWDFCNTNGSRDLFSMRQNWGGGQTTGYNGTGSLFGTATFGSSVTGVWKNYAFVRRNNILYAYVDGVLNNTGSTMTDAIGTINKLIIGQDNIGTNFINGDYGNFLVYNRGLTDAEVAQNFKYYRNRYKV